MGSREEREEKEGAKGAALSLEGLATLAIDCGLKLHQDLGPGLLETAYEKVLAHRLRQSGLDVVTQLAVPITVDGLVIDPGFRIDILVDQRLLIEVKSVERQTEVHAKQVLTYLRLMNLPLGLLMNFSGEKFSHGLKRIVNSHRNAEGSQLRLHQ